jgi:para-nitrobenzyl esterase
MSTLKSYHPSKIIRREGGRMKNLFKISLALLLSDASQAFTTDGKEKIVLTYPAYRCQDVKIEKTIYLDELIEKKVGFRTIKKIVKVPKTIMVDQSLWYLKESGKKSARLFDKTCRSYGPIAERFGVVPSIAHYGWVCVGSQDLKNQSYWYTKQEGIENGKIYDSNCFEWANKYGDEYYTLENYEKAIRVKTSEGSSLKGIYDKTDKGAPSVAFKGVPFAKAPVGKLRWKLPKPIDNLGQFNADKFGPACPQPLGKDEYIKQVGVSEDCLHLNVWKPVVTNASSNLPVIVWIHGGGLNSGVSHKTSYRGASMAAKGSIFVSMNYRLGHLGFFAHSAQNKNEPRGNYGLYDQIEALRWVKRNIKNFGGNPNNITIIGESAGASSVLYHLTSDKTKGLFHKAIMQSTPVLINHPPVDGKNESSPYALTAVQTSSLLANKLGCKNNDSKVELDCLKKFPARKLPELGKTLRAGFFIDDYLHKKTPRIIATEEGGLRQIPIMIGSNEDEYTFFGKVPHKSTNEFRKFFIDSFGYELAQDLLDLYPSRNMTEMRESYIDFHTDYMFGVDAMYTASTNVMMGNKNIYHYHFSRVAPGAERIGLDAAHGLEIPYFFDNIPVDDVHDFYSQIDHDIASDMSLRILNFSKTGSPNTFKRRDIKWNAYTPLGESLKIGDDITTMSGHLDKEARTLIEAKKVTLPLNVPPILDRLFERTSK